MASFTRHLGLRVATVAVPSALVVLGLEAPASAAPPTISSFSPTSGPTGCVEVIRGTNFDNPIVASVDIGGTPVSAFRIVSSTEIWATVAGDASGTIHVGNSSDTASSGNAFSNANPGGLLPNDHVLHAMRRSGGDGDDHLRHEPAQELRHGREPPVGGSVRFAPYTATATHTGAPETPKQLSLLVPSDAADGPIRVSTFNDVVGEGAFLSDISFFCTAA